MLRIFILVIGLVLIAQGTLAQEEEKPPVLMEKIVETSPDGKFAMRIKYDKALNDRMLSGNNPKPPHDIFSQAISMIELVSLPEKEAVAILFDAEKEGGNTFGITLLWSTDSKWCAFFLSYPRTGYTTVYNLRGKKFKAVNKPEDLSPPTKGSVRNEHIIPKRWVKPGTLQLSVERVFRGDDEADGVNGFIARFDGKGKFQILRKIR
ncbi:MAG TPA: hypothetical protein VEX43_03350 [Chthoniobacterales bacterium]|nr:hypothetical protein [Chthoniobacterales bacterium]